MTAIVTNFREYVKGKAVQDAAKRLALSSLTDDQLSTRLIVLERIEDGVLKIDKVPEFIRDNLFPGGYDPSQPKDNVECIRAEIARREGSTT